MRYNSLIKPPASKLLKAGKVVLEPGEDVGEHVTEKKEEVLVILKGTAMLQKEDKIIELKQGETHYIEEGVKHNVFNKTNRALEYVYVVGPI